MRDWLPSSYTLKRWARFVCVALFLFCAGMYAQHTRSTPEVRTETKVVARNVPVPGPTVTVTAVPVTSDVCKQALVKADEVSRLSVQYTGERGELQDILRELSTTTATSQVEVNKYKERLGDLYESTSTTDERLAGATSELEQLTKECKG